MIFSIRDAEKVICQVTGWIVIPSGWVEQADKVLSLLQHYGWDETINRLTAAKNNWINQKNKTTGAHYKLTNPAWIDYAITGETLGAPPELSDIEREQAEIALYAKRIPK